MTDKEKIMEIKYIAETVLTCNLPNTKERLTEYLQYNAELLEKIAEKVELYD